MRSCEEEFRVSHSMTENKKFVKCVKVLALLTRVPSIFSNLKIERKQKVGNLVKEFIEESKEDLKEQKKDLRK